MPHVIENVTKSPNSFFLLKHEDFNEKPKEIFQLIYQWLGENILNMILTIYQNQTIMNMIQLTEHK